jgi:sulfatase modifying factor 1
MQMRVGRPLAFVLLCASCSGSTRSQATASACVPGATQICVGAGACRGAQVCLASGAGFGPCDCGAASGTQGGSTGNPASAGTSGTALASGASAGSANTGSANTGSANTGSANSSGSGSGSGVSTGSTNGSGSGKGSGSSGSSDAGVFAPSCAPGGPGLTNCGPNSESCCASLEVTGGTYFRTYTNAGGGPTGEADPATVSSFRLDKYLVTVGRFRQFVNAWDGGKGYAPQAGSGKHTHLNGGRGLNATGGGYEPGWVAGGIAPTDANLTTNCYRGVPPDATWTPSAGSQENLPINCVNWWESYAFCIWDGGFLPSEAEWEYAAAGGSQQREYPWGSTDPGTNNQQAQYAIYDCYYGGGTAIGNCTGDTGYTLANIAPVGTATLGAGLWGQIDLAGDLFEWNLDSYAAYAACTDCADLSAAPDRMMRGGSFNSPASFLLPPFRNEHFTPTDRNISLGFRCARTP